MDYSAQESTPRVPFPVMVKQLSEVIGKKFVAYMGGLKHADLVDLWQTGVKAPPEDIQNK